MVDVLWIEDESHILLAVLEELREHWTVDTAVSCDVAIEKLRTKQYAAIVADIILPITTGMITELAYGPVYKNSYEDKYRGVWLIRQIREELGLNTPIIVYTIVAGSDKTAIRDLLADSIQGYASKYETMPESLVQQIELVIECSKGAMGRIE